MSDGKSTFHVLSKVHIRLAPLQELMGIFATIFCAPRNLDSAKAFYLRAIDFNSLSPAPYTGLGMVAQINGDLDLCIQKYHQVCFRCTQAFKVANLGQYRLWL